MKPIPSAIEWLYQHSLDNLERRTADEIHDIAVVSYAAAKLMREMQEEYSITVKWPDGGADIFCVIGPDESRQALAARYRAKGASVSAATSGDLPEVPQAETTYKFLILLHPSAEDAEKKIAEMAEGLAVRDIKIRELFFALAVIRLKDALDHIDDEGNWTPDAIEHYSQAAAAVAIGSGEPRWRVTAFRGDIETARDHGRRGGKRRAEKANPIREEVARLWEVRTNRRETKRAFAMRIQPKILALARERNIPFAPSNAVRRISEMIRAYSPYR
jgi:hypothetical protein